MALQQIKPAILDEWRKNGEILTIWGCERCYKKIPFYVENPFVDSIKMMWAKNHKYCKKCYNKINGIIIIIKSVHIPRINILLGKYEMPEIDPLYD